VDAHECLQLLEQQVRGSPLFPVVFCWNSEGSRAQEKYLKWEHVTELTVRGHKSQLHRQQREGSDLYEYFVYGSLPITADQLVDANWDIEYRMKVCLAKEDL
jgi:hypothetical protein